MLLQCINLAGSDGNRQDPRMKHLKKEWFYGKRCLDIGCNTGAISFEIGALSDRAPRF